MVVQMEKDPSGSKITIRVLAAGFTSAWLTMQIPYAKTTLDVTYYTYHIDIYTPVNIFLFLGMITFGIVVGGTYLTRLKGNGN